MITGANGFVGKNLTQELRNIRSGKEQSAAMQALFSGASVRPEEIELFCFDTDKDEAALKEYCAGADFIFHLAGVNRPKEERAFMEGNHDLLRTVLQFCEEAGNFCPVLLSSSTQASLDNPYGKSKRAAEELLRSYAEKNNARVFIYRFPNIFGKWCRPAYNSAVATFCHNVAYDLPIEVSDPKREMHLVYIDDVVEEMLHALCGKPHALTDAELFACEVPVSYHVSLGEIADAIQSFPECRASLSLPDVGDGFTKKLYSTFLSYLPPERLGIPLKMNTDARGFFAELIRIEHFGQISVNVSRPGITKGQHWHHTKVERFVVVSGTGLIRMRRLGTDENGEPYPVTEIKVSGDKLQVVEMIPGFAHNLINLSDTEDMVTVIWANEPFDETRPDTYHETVELA